MGLIERGVEVDRIRWENPQARPLAGQREEVSHQLPAKAARDAEVGLPKPCFHRASTYFLEKRALIVSP